MSFFSQFVAIWNNAARSIRRHGLVRGFSYYLYTVLVRKCPFGRGRLVSLKVPRTHDVVKARLGTHDAAAFRQIFLTGDYDFPLTEEPRVVVDAGAHVGYGATFFTLKYPDAKIYSLEPEPSNAVMLRLNTAPYPNITVIESALWNTDAALSIIDPAADVWSFRVSELTTGEQGGGIKAITMPQIVSEVGHIDVLKIDIEGAEVEVFSGKVDWLDHVGCIVIELHDERRDDCSGTFYEAIKDRKYSEERFGENLVIRFQAEAVRVFDTGNEARVHV